MRHKQGEKLRDADKVERIPVKVIESEEYIRKPDWIRVRLPASPEIDRIKKFSEKMVYPVCVRSVLPQLR